MPIKVNKIIPFVCKAYDPNGKFLGHLNEYEFHDLRVQIKKEAAVGYYMVYEDEKIPIDKDGRLPSWPKGFYDAIEYSMMQLL